MGPQRFRQGKRGRIGAIVKDNSRKSINKTINTDTNVSGPSFIGDVDFGSVPMAGFGSFAALPALA